MPPNLVLMAQVLALALLLNGHVQTLPEPFLAFIPGLEGLAPPSVFRGTLQVLVVLSALAILGQRWLRTSCFILGGTLVLAVLSSRVYYTNSKLFVSCLLMLVALSDFERPAQLFRWQLALIYFGAGLNKLLEPDWRTGQFFDFWALDVLENPVYRALAVRLPSLWLGKLLCWGTIAGELGIALGCLLPRGMRWALLANVALHVALLELTGSTFDLFFFAMVAVTLPFAPERQSRSTWWTGTVLVSLAAAAGPWPLRLLVGGGVAYLLVRVGSGGERPEQP